VVVLVVVVYVAIWVVEVWSLWKMQPMWHQTPSPWSGIGVELQCLIDPLELLVVEVTGPFGVWKEVVLEAVEAYELKEHVLFDELEVAAMVHHNN
jgi:hypothetical protein